MHNDNIEIFDKCIIQHGNYNNRIYVMKTGLGISKDLPNKLITLAKENGYTKIIAKVPKKVKNYFFDFNFQKEATIPSFYLDGETVFFMSYYLNPKREKNSEDLKKILNNSISKKTHKQTTITLKIEKCNILDIEKMAEVYKTVFSSYPFPIYQKKYLEKTMSKNVEYFCIKQNDTIIALASCEKDIENKNVEMTDFAVLNEYRGNNLAYFLLKKMEEEMRKQRYKTFYTIARAKSVGINKTFSKSGYTYSGTLKNNTNISGKIESMNIWYKIL